MAGIGRRTWDKELYEQKAKDRLERLDEEGLSKSSTGVSSAAAKKIMKEEFEAAEKGSAGPMGSQRAFLKVRESKIDLESKIGKTEIIAPGDAEIGRGAGFWCDVCSCLLKDSSAYLDHINGRKRKLSPFPK
jgi:U4/U6.U5 tri-snRNP component SNU23